MPQIDLESFDPKVGKNIQRWLTKDFDEKTKQEILFFLKTDPSKLTDAFYTKLKFGTAGIRGIMGLGTSRINSYTIRAATQGLAEYIKDTGAKNPSVLIGYDNRNYSSIFGQEVACVLAFHKIKVYLFNELRPTPFISFCSRHLKCTAAIMITASHNPPEYNGYKVYWTDGGQITAPHDKKIIQKINAIQDLEKIGLSKKEDPYIERIDNQLDQVYLDVNLNLRTNAALDDLNGAKLSILYTSFHGAGITLLPKALKQWGFSNISFVEEQISIDGNFPFAKSPNPEEDEALSLGKKIMLKDRHDLFISTDPDADRMGVVVKHKEEAYKLSGNQVACICLYHLIKHLDLKKDSFFVKTIVTTELFAKIAKDYECLDVLTGFKYIAKEIEQRPDSFIFGAEESCGYLYGTNTRDKDAIITSCLIAEIALIQKLKNETLIDLLYEIYETYGVYRESLISISFFDTPNGIQTMQKIMNNLRVKKLDTVDNVKIAVFEDYLSSQTKENGRISTISLPKSNVLRLFLENDTKIVIRPSGTEPKIKVYFGAVQKSGKNVTEKIALCDQRLKHLEKTVCNILFEK